MFSFRRVLLAFVVAVLQSPASAETSFVTYEGGPLFEVGQGVNSATSDGVSTCVTDARAEPRSAGISQTVDVDYITSSTSMLKALDVGAYAAYFGALANFTASTRFSESETQARERVSFYMKVSVRGASQRLIRAQPSDPVREAVKAGMSEFVRACGDSYVERIESGGEFLVIINHDKTDSSTESNLRTDIQVAATTTRVDAQLERRLKQTANDLNLKVHLVQVGLGAKSPPSLVDVNQLMDYGRTFAAAVAESNNASQQALVAYRVHLRKYSESLEFVNMFREVQRGQLQNFDPSIDILKDIAEAYDQVYQRIVLVRQALLNPNDFKNVSDQAALEVLQKKLVTKANGVKSLATACAERTRAGLSCENVTIDLSDLTLGFTRLPLCQSPDEGQKRNGCTRVARFGETCACVACEFERAMKTVNKGAPLKNVCRGMPPGKRINASFATRISHFDGRVADLWYGAQFTATGEKASAWSHSTSGRSSYDLQDKVEAVVPASGEVAIEFSFDRCQPNLPPPYWDGCRVEPLSGGGPAFQVEAIQ